MQNKQNIDSQLSIYLVTKFPVEESKMANIVRVSGRLGMENFIISHVSTSMHVVIKNFKAHVMSDVYV